VVRAIFNSQFVVWLASDSHRPRSGTWLKRSNLLRQCTQLSVQLKKSSGIALKEVSCRSVVATLTATGGYCTKHYRKQERVSTHVFNATNTRESPVRVFYRPEADSWRRCRVNRPVLLFCEISRQNLRGLIGPVVAEIVLGLIEFHPVEIVYALPGLDWLRTAFDLPLAISPPTAFGGNFNYSPNHKAFLPTAFSEKTEHDLGSS